MELGLQTTTDAEVLSGLSEGEQVVVSDRSGLKPSQKVHPQSHVRDAVPGTEVNAQCRGSTASDWITFMPGFSNSQSVLHHRGLPGAAGDFGRTVQHGSHHQQGQGANASVVRIYFFAHYINLPEVVVATFYSGMPPEDIETDITDPLERFFTLAAGVDHMESRSLLGVSIIRVYFQPGTSPDADVTELSNLALADLKRLPPGTLPPVVLKFDASSLPVALVTPLG